MRVYVELYHMLYNVLHGLSAVCAIVCEVVSVESFQWHRFITPGRRGVMCEIKIAVALLQRVIS